MYSLLFRGFSTIVRWYQHGEFPYKFDLFLKLQSFFSEREEEERDKEGAIIDKEKPPTRDGFVAMNKALKQRVEKLYPRQK